VPLTTSHQLRDNYLYFHSSGATDEELEAAVSHIQHLLQIAGEHHYPPILMDRRNVALDSGPTPHLFLNQLGDLLIQHGYLQHAAPSATGPRIAILTPPDTIDHFILIESIVHARGINIRFFAEEPAAIEWLSTAA